MSLSVHFGAVGRLTVGRRVLKGYSPEVIQQRTEAIQKAKREVKPINNVVIHFDEVGDHGSYGESSTLNEFATLIVPSEGLEAVRAQESRKEKESFSEYVQRVVSIAKETLESLTLPKK